MSNENVIELKKINEPSGKYWYGIWVNGSCQIPSYGTDFEGATAAYEQVVENMKNPLPKEETIFSTKIKSNEPANS